MAKTRQRILQAVIALHAECGPRRTSYAMIAQRADVAVPTVYKHFPNLAEMFAACIGHVSAQAPPLGPELFETLPNSPARLEMLVRTLFARHRFFSPWLRWSSHEAHLLPELEAHHRQMHERQLQLVAAALAPALGPHPPPALIGLIDILVGFPSWQTLTKAQALSDEAAASVVNDAIQTLLGRYCDQGVPIAGRTTQHPEARSGR